MRFKAFEQVSFRLSERTSYETLVKARLSFRHNVGEVVALLSQTEDQLVFVHGYTSLDGGAKVLTSHRLRLTKGTWDILKLREYAELVGLKIDDWSLLNKALGKARKVVVQAIRKVPRAA